MESMPDGMPCCPDDKPAVPDCAKDCPLAVLCVTSFVSIQALDAAGIIERTDEGKVCGGSAKTTTTAHLSQFLALRGYRALAIDLDSAARAFL